MEQRDVLIQKAVIAAKRICEEMETSTKRRVRREKHEENSHSVVLSLEHKVQREMF